MNEKLQELKTTSAYLLVFLFLELSAVIYISTIHLSPTQMSDYEQAKQDLVQMNREEASIQLAEKEDPHVRQGLNALLVAKPEGCDFLELSVGDLNDENGESHLYAYITVMTENDRVLQAFRENINNNPALGDASIDSVYQDSSGHRIVRLSVGRAQP
ncbi:hypothetical protein HMPREF9334_00378 [Selenomonas infelix ATCC 43532]|uniref:General secretion pathway protein M n=2 Tax=Selenomonas TaxID=970 RepID=G5GM97_9FIRM|nr:hypothetical protein HMPREF9334_00378 [Selenomonas infelix ATCC 43532]